MLLPLFSKIFKSSRVTSIVTVTAGNHFLSIRKNSKETNLVFGLNNREIAITSIDSKCTNIDSLEIFQRIDESQLQNSQDYSYYGFALLKCAIECGGGISELKNPHFLFFRAKSSSPLFKYSLEPFEETIGSNKILITGTSAVKDLNIAPEHVILRKRIFDDNQIKEDREIKVDFNLNL